MCRQGHTKKNHSLKVRGFVWLASQSGARARTRTHTTRATESRVAWAGQGRRVRLPTREPAPAPAALADGPGWLRAPADDADRACSESAGRAGPDDGHGPSRRTGPTPRTRSEPIRLGLAQAARPDRSPCCDRPPPPWRLGPLAKRLASPQPSGSASAAALPSAPVLRARGPALPMCPGLLPGRLGAGRPCHPGLGPGASTSARGRAPACVFRAPQATRPGRSHVPAPHAGVAGGDARAPDACAWTRLAPYRRRRPGDPAARGLSLPSVRPSESAPARPPAATARHGVLP